MALERPEAGWVWLHVPRKEPVVVVVTGDIHTWWAHFARVPGARTARAVRCIGQDGRSCRWCAEEIGRRARYVFPVQVEAGPRLVELGRVQFGMLSMLYESGQWVGRRLRLRREWDAANARIIVEPAGQEVITDEMRADVGEYVSSLGLTEYATMKPPQGGGSPSKSSGSGAAPAAVDVTRNAWSDHRE